MDGIFQGGDTKIVRARLVYLAARNYGIPQRAATELVERVFLDFQRDQSGGPTALVRQFRQACQHHIMAPQDLVPAPPPGSERA